MNDREGSVRDGVQTSGMDSLFLLFPDLGLREYADR